MLKRIMAFILVVCMFVSMPVVTKATTTQKDRTDTLHDINVLRGTGTDYNLEGQLKRSEAAAFIVRLLGVENEVIENKDMYSKTGFTDIKETDWHAMYVGYVAKNGIVGGYGNGSYGPDNYVTEKQFTKMVLGALGYKQGTDFTWAEVYNFAYEKKLYEDVAYATRTEDKTNYTREHVINLLYTSLDKEINKTTTTILKRLVDKKFITEETAVKTNLYTIDTVKMAVEKIEATTLTTIKIVLNEKVVDTSNAKVVMYNKDKNNEELAVSSLVANEKELVITTASQKVGVTYKVGITGLVDSEGNTSKVEADVIRRTSSIIASDFFRIANIHPISKNVIQIEFTQPINQGIEFPLYYSLYKDGKEVVSSSFTNLSPKTVGASEYIAEIFFKNYTMEDGALYTLKITGDLPSIYGVKLNSGQGDAFTFTAKGTENDTLQVVSVEPLEKDYVIVTFNMDVDKASATSISNYALKDENSTYTLNSSIGAAFVGEGDQKYRKVKIRLINLVSDHNYMLTIKNIKDAHQQTTIKEVKSPFYGYPVNADSLKIDYVYAENQNTIKVYFNRNITNEIVNATFTIPGVSIASKSFTTKEPMAVTLYTSSSTPLNSKTTYALTALNVKNEFNIVYTHSLTYSFNGSDVESGAAYIVDSKFIDNDVVLLTFNTSMHQTSNIASKFKVEYKEGNTEKTKTAIQANFITPKIAIIKFDSLTNGVPYKLTGTNLVDYSSQFTSLSINTEVQR